MSFLSPPAPTINIPPTPGAPAPPPTFGAQTQPVGTKPQAKGQPTFLGAGLTANPSNTGQKTLLGT